MVDRLLTRLLSLSLNRPVQNNTHYMRAADELRAIMNVLEPWGPKSSSSSLSRTETPVGDGGVVSGGVVGGGVVSGGVVCGGSANKMWTEPTGFLPLV